MYLICFRQSDKVVYNMYIMNKFHLHMTKCFSWGLCFIASHGTFYKMETPLILHLVH